MYSRICRILKQNINLTYQSVYENDEANFSSSSSSELQLQHTKNNQYSSEVNDNAYIHKERQQTSSLSRDSSERELRVNDSNQEELIIEEGSYNPNPRVPYYVSDIGDVKKKEQSAMDSVEVSSGNNKISLDTTITTLERAKAVDKLEDEMKFLDAETNKHLRSEFSKDYEQSLADSALKRIRRRVL